MLFNYQQIKIHFLFFFNPKYDTYIFLWPLSVLVVVYGI